MGLGNLKKKSGGGFGGGGWVENVLGGDFVLWNPNPFLKSDQIVSVQHHMVESRSVNGSLVA